jgi:hypothetical protein
MGTGKETEKGKKLQNQLIPMTRTPTETIEGLEETPVGAEGRNGTMLRRFHHDNFRGRQGRLAKSILGIALLEGAVLFDRHGDEQAYLHVSRNRSMAVPFGPGGDLMVTQNHNANLDTFGSACSI